MRCNCKPTSKHPCSTNVCSCRRSRLRCVSPYGGCHGNKCVNEEPMQHDVDVENGGGSFE